MKNLQNFGVQELNAEEIKEIDGGSGWLRILKKAYEVVRDSAIYEGLSYAVNNALTPEQAADYRKYRGM
jgi:hypothetical protein